LGHALEASREDERRPELAEPSGQGERRGSAEPRGGERESDPREDPERPRPERSGGLEQRAVDSFEARDRGPQIERGLDEGDREDDGDLCEGDIDPQRAHRAAEQAEAPEGDQ